MTHEQTGQNMSTAYLWMKAFHLIAMVSWFAGLFYMPRLFVYHSRTEDAAGKARFSMMEEKLYRIIMRPAMVTTVVFGIALLVLGWSALFNQLWIWLKILLVVGLIGYHHVCGRLIRDFAAGTNRHPERWYRIFNEIPTLVLIAVILLAVLKPF